MLEKKTLEFPLRGGLMERVPDELKGDGYATVALNVDIRKEGAVRRRRGFSQLSNAAVVDATNTVMDTNFRRLSTRDNRSLVVVSDESKTLGSGGGSSGRVGSTIYEFADGLDSWIANGNIPIPTVSHVWSQAKVSSAQVSTAVAVGNGYMLCGSKCYYEKNVSSTVELIDLSSGTCIQKFTVGSVTWVGGAFLGNYLYLFDSTAGWVRVNTLSPGGGYGVGNLPGVATSSNSVQAVSDMASTWLYVMHISTPGVMTLSKFNSAMAAIGSVALTAITTTGATVDARRGVVDVAYNDTLTMVYERRDADLAPLWPAFALTTPDVGYDFYICTIDAGVPGSALLVYDTAASDDGRFRIVGNGGALYAEHVIAGRIIKSQPWLVNGHCYAVTLEGNQTLPTGRLCSTMVCVEIDIDTATADNLYKTCLPSASWFTNVGSLLCDISVYQSAGKSYVIHGKWVDGGDMDWDYASQIAGQGHTVRPTVMALEFSNSKRYKSVDWNGLTLFGGGILWAYDGMHAHEAAQIHWPRLDVSNNAAGAGSLVLGETYRFYSVFKYTDRGGRIFWSQPSSTGENNEHTVTNVAVDGAIELTVSIPNLTAMPQGGFSFGGSIACQVYASTQSAPDVAVFLSEFQVDQFHQGPLPVLTVSSFPTTETRYLYTVGGELENVAPPPALAIENHRGRVWLLATDEPKAWYSKPSRPLRGPEFCLEFTFDLPDFGTAIVSNEDRVIIFTAKAIYFVEGDGPGPTGVPVNGFSRLSQLYVDEGCVEVNAAVRTPFGIIYRGRRGFMLLTRSLEVKYIGESCEDSFAERVDSIISMVHDPKLGCCVIRTEKSGVYSAFRFWYDSQQWTIDELRDNSFDVRDSIALGDSYYEAIAGHGVWQVQDPASGIHADNGAHFEWVWETGWLRWQDLHSFKRVWRLFLSAKSLGGRSQLKVELFADFDDTPFQVESLRVEGSEATSFRIHLARQKLKNLKVRVTDQRGTGAVEDWGAELLGLGFEVALKTGGAKLPQGATR